MQPLYSRQKLCFKTCRCMNRNNPVCFIFILASSSIYIVQDDKHWLSLRFAGSVETILKKRWRRIIIFRYYTGLQFALLRVQTRTIKNTYKFLTINKSLNKEATTFKKQTGLCSSYAATHFWVKVRDSYIFGFLFEYLISEKINII